MCNVGIKECPSHRSPILGRDPDGSHSGGGSVDHEEIRSPPLCGLILVLTPCQ